jgi:hypothetical protein
VDIESPAPPLRLEASHALARLAIANQPDYATARRLARRLAEGQWRVISLFDDDGRGRPVPDTLRLRIDLRWYGAWEPVITAPWTVLPLEWVDVLALVANVNRQRRDGTYPGGPRDPYPAVDPTAN